MDKFTVVFTDEFDNTLDKLSEEHRRLVLNKITILKTNPFYKSLRTKKIKGYYESSVNMDIRIIWQFAGSQIIVLLDVGHHDVIRKYNKRKY